ncbi:glycoside hydrolase family 3 C-terminal domain-containing protein [Hallella absiana]|uniref:glycoside hydrolase family 3 C-terminal domain-containing protein n=1 Tax=Hallella absiana TaxID=2925336 RepID=UPI0021C75572|nr:glycoside hydrolase family 3 C-terminal domain-containing protein [Hallella absiana]
MSKFFLSFFLLTLPFLAFAQQPVYLDDSQPIERRIDDAMSRMTLQEKINILHAQSKFSSRGVPRLGFPDFWTDDGPHGVRPDVLWDEWEQAGQTNDSCVAFPALTCLAATWNPSLAWHYGRSLGEEARYRGKDMILGPGVNILRTPLGGRNFEYMGEDPWLVSTMVVPYIRGLQSNGVAACVKHFALNNDEENRHQVNVKVSDRALHEIYLPAFHAAVTNGGAWGLMGAYNLYRDEHNCHNEYLLKDLLKGQWGFDGVVVSDWGGCHDTDQAVNNGLDMEFGSWTDGLHTGASNAYDNYYLANAYRDGLLSGKYSMQTLNDKVRRVLRLFFRTTMARRGHGALCSDAHYQTARRIADEGIVLLQNRGDVLPLDLSHRPTVLVVGENAIKMMTVGGGSSSLKAQREISPLDGLKARLKDVATVEYERGYVGDTTGAYNGVTTGQNLTDTRSRQQLIADAVAKARKADYVIVVGGLNKSDYQDCEGHDRKEYGLPYGQDELVEALAKANRRVVFVNISGNPVAMPWHDRVAAIVQGWYGGSESGEALADVLSGDVCPSGKLPFTWPVKLQDVGAHALKTYPGTWRDGHKIIDETYSEGVYVGYRWTEAKHIRPLFAFGHGLGYTSFKLSDLRLSSSSLTAADSLTVTVNVRNTGHRAGAETVQLYIHDDKCSVDRPVKELKGFAKVALQPGESKDVKIVIGRDALSFYDEKQGAWTAEPGTFTALVGNASDNIVLKRSFILK